MSVITPPDGGVIGVPPPAARHAAKRERGRAAADGAAGRGPVRRLPGQGRRQLADGRDRLPAEAPPGHAASDPPRPPPSGAEVCVGSVYLNVVTPAGWSGVPSLLAHATPGVHVWQERSLQYGFTPCRGCPAPGLDPAQVERDHPEWILKDVSGADVHPPGHPSWVMYDIANVDYLDGLGRRGRDPTSSASSSGGRRAGRRRQPSGLGVSAGRPLDRQGADRLTTTPC